jgi:hypothetical protein
MMNIYYVVIKRSFLTEVIDSLTQYSLWFGIEPWPGNDYAVQVKPENQERLRQITQDTQPLRDGTSKL